MTVGDYVRTKYAIAKCIRAIPILENSYLYYFDRNIDETIDEYIDFCTESELEEYKSSPNIIDLFDEHDLVVIEYYSLRYNERVTRLFEVTFKDNEYINLSNAKCEFMLVNGEFNKGDKELNPIIKSIVTKEQFESMEYKVGEEN